MKLKTVLSKMTNNHFASVYDAMLKQEAEYPTYRGDNNEDIASSLIALGAAPLKVLHGVALIVGGVVIAVIPGLELKLKTKEKEHNGCKRSEIKSVKPAFNMHGPCTNHYEANGTRGDKFLLGSNLVFGYQEHPKRVNPNAIPPNANVSLTGAQMVWSGAGVVLEGTVETVGALPQAALQAGVKIKNR